MSTASEMDRAQELLKSVALSPQARFPLPQVLHIEIYIRQIGHRVGKPTDYRFVMTGFSEGK